MTNTIPNVPRELLADLLGNDHDKRIMAERHLLAMLANAPSPAGVDGLPEFLTQELEAVGQEAVAKAVDDQCSSVPVLQAVYGEAIRKRVVDDAQAIIDGLRGEVAKINSDRLACWAEFKVMTRACLDAEKERDQQAETISNYKSQFSELHTARNLLSRLSAAGFELGDDAAVSVIAERDQQAQRIGELEGLLLRVQVSLSLDDTEWGYSGAEKYKLLADIRAALSAGKEDAQ